MTTQTVAPRVLRAGGRILILQLQRLGDSIAVTPVVRAIRRTYPDAMVDVLAGPTAAEMYHGWPLVRRTYIVARGRTVGQRVMTAVYALYTIRRERYDCVLACTNHVSLRHGIVAWLTGARRRIGFDGGRARGFFTHLLPTDPRRSCYEENLELAGALGARVDRGDAQAPDMWRHPENAVMLDRFLAARGIAKDCRLVVLHPGSNWQSKIWFPERWAFIADRLARDGHRPVFIGSADEQSRVAQIQRMMHTQAVSLAGETSIEMLATLLRRAALFVGTDSGPRHLAGVVGCRQVTVMSAQDQPGRWRIPGAQEIVLRATVPCAGCLRQGCAHRQCLDVILADQVIAACRRVLGGNSPAGARQELSRGE